MQQWNNTLHDKDYIASLECLVSNRNDRVLQAEVYVNYGKHFDDRDSIKRSRHVVFLDPGYRVTAFVEKWESLVGGRGQVQATMLKSADVSAAGRRIEFTRAVGNGLRLRVDCLLPN